MIIIEQKGWAEGKGWQTYLEGDFGGKLPQLVLIFGGRKTLEDTKRFDEVRNFYPDSSSHIISCSTAGEILGTTVSDNTISLTAIYFEKSRLEFAEEGIQKTEDSEMVGGRLAGSIPSEGLVHVLVYSDGLLINGTALVKGLTSKLPKNISVTGGLVGDGADFKKTLVGLDKAPESGKVVLVGFYGGSLKVGYGSLGGWDSFGPERLITKAKDNVLYELDGKPALGIYKEYLGDKAKDLPASGLLFPLSLKLNTESGDTEVVRTLLAIDEKEQSMTFAGDMPEGVSAKLMKANFERLIDGAGGAAEMSGKDSNMHDPDLAILVSCVGRKLVLKERIEEETEAVKEVLGENVKLTGFYSYGEISPVTPTEKQCRLHNQTMTITTFKEV